MRTKICIRILLANQVYSKFCLWAWLTAEWTFMLLSGNLGNYLQSSNFPVSSTYHDSACITLYILQIHHSDIKLWRASVMLQSLLLTDHMTTPSIKERNLPKSMGGGRIFERKQNIPEKQDKSKKINPRHNLHTLTFAAWLRSETHHPLAPHILPGWSHFLQLTVQMS